MHASTLFTPFQVKSLLLKNRIVMAPMTRRFSPGGVPGPDVAMYYRRRAEGEVGLIITEGTWIPHPSASDHADVPRFYGEDALAGWARVVDEVHAAGGKIMPQLWHVGTTKAPTAEQGDFVARAVSPSGILSNGEPIGQPMSQAQIHEITNAYAEAAASAKKLGFDGVEIHAAHGYLIDQFFWQRTNIRDDAYGGDLSQRTRFACNIIRSIRSRVGEDFPIVLRFSQWKMQDYAAKLVNDAKQLEMFLTPLVEAGVDVFHCSTRRFWEPEFAGSSLNLAGWTKAISGRPAITVGSVSLDQDFTTSFQSGKNAEVTGLEQLRRGIDNEEFDLVAIGRSLLTNPNWPALVKSGNIDQLQPFSPGSLRQLT